MSSAIYKLAIAIERISMSIGGKCWLSQRDRDEALRLAEEVKSEASSEQIPNCALCPHLEPDIARAEKAEQEVNGSSPIDSSAQTERMQRVKFPLYARGALAERDRCVGILRDQISGHAPDSYSARALRAAIEEIERDVT